MENHDKYLTIHGHFYQPPRENPWLEEIELQESAHPSHNWNERVCKECYSPNSVSRIADDRGRILQIINNYEYLSFNFGPTLLSWMEKYAKKTYARILEADKLSQEAHSGHGNAMAQVYNHTIMPFCNEQDKITQTVWGIKDFKHRFKRKPEGIWLAECGVDEATLEVLADEGIKFTVLSPYQAQCVKKIGDKDFKDVSWGSIDPSMPYRCFLKNGKHIDIYFYDGAISKSVAFDNLLKDGGKFIARLNDGYVKDRCRPQLVNIATDGESYGHHTKFGDMALSYIFALKAEDWGFKITNYAEFLDKFPPTWEVKIKNETAWSCSHGIGRWECDCGCQTGGQPHWNQKWRTPLRKALDFLRDKLIILCEIEGNKYFKNFWDARNDYISVILDRSEKNINKFLTTHAKKKLNPKEKVLAIKLLEIQRQAMLMYTSCGWFFSEISGIETVQIMKYALMAIDLAKEFTKEDLERGFCQILSKAISNIPEFGTGEDIFNNFCKPSKIDIEQIVNHWAIMSAYEGFEEINSIYCYDVQNVKSKIVKNKDDSKLFIGKGEFVSKITTEKHEMIFVMFRNQEGRVYCAINKADKKDFSKIKTEIEKAFKSGDEEKTTKVMKDTISKHFYMLKDVLIDKRKEALKKSISKKLRDMANIYEKLYENSKANIEHLIILGMDIPEAFRVSAKYTLAKRLTFALKETKHFTNKAQIKKIMKIKEEANKFHINFNKTKIDEIVGLKIKERLEKLVNNPTMKQTEEIISLFALIDDLELNFEMISSQNLYFERIFRNMHTIIESLRKSQNKDEDRLFVLNLLKIGDYLKINTEYYKPLIDTASLPR